LTKKLEVLSADSLVTLDLPELESVMQDVVLNGGWGKNRLMGIRFPKLKKVGGKIAIESWSEVEYVNFPALNSVLSLSLLSLEKTETITIPLLESVHGEVKVSYTPQLKSFDFSKIKTIGGDMWIENAWSLEDLRGLSSLTDVGGQLFLSDLNSLKSTEGLKNLTSIGGRLWLSRLSLSEDDHLSGLANLSDVGGYISISSTPVRKFTGFSLSQAGEISITGGEDIIISEIDVSHLEITKSLKLQNLPSPVIVKGPDIAEYLLDLSNANVQLSGFKEVNQLNIYINDPSFDPYTLHIEKVKGIASIQLLYITDFKMPELISVDERFDFIIHLGNKVAFPKLQTTGQTILDIAHLESFSMPALETVKGDLTITTGKYDADKLKELQFTSLKTVDGALSVAGYSSYYSNTKLTNLNGFGSLQNVKGISVNYNSALIDFSGLKNILASITAADWNVANNGYNPTYQDMMEGKYTSP
jgi:hypothetical protein